MTRILQMQDNTNEVHESFQVKVEERHHLADNKIESKIKLPFRLDENFKYQCEFIMLDQSLCFSEKAILCEGMWVQDVFLFLS